jgi:Protein of unknown function (DUF1493)
MTQQNTEALSKRVINQIVTKGWGLQRKGHLISPESQIYYDLRIYGDDFFELVRWMHEEFGVQTMSGFENYAPLESPFQFLAPAIRKFLGRPEPRYCSLTVVDITNIITSGKWPS